jgi:hypothetical protein
MVRAACGFGPTHDHETRDAILELAYQTRAIGVNLTRPSRRCIVASCRRMRR